MEGREKPTAEEAAAAVYAAEAGAEEENKWAHKATRLPETIFLTGGR
jgi:hypothetical protein